MVGSIEFVTCVAVIAGAVQFASAEYRKLRTARRCNAALRRTFCDAFGD